MAGNQTLNGQGPIDVTAHTTNYTLTVNDNGSAHTSTGATGAITCTLPAATVGLHYYFYVGATQEHRVDPSGTETMSLPSSGAVQAAGAYLTADAIGESLHIACFKAGHWAVVSSVGTWTAV